MFEFNSSSRYFWRVIRHQNPWDPTRFVEIAFVVSHDPFGKDAEYNLNEFCTEATHPVTDAIDDKKNRRRGIIYTCLVDNRLKSKFLEIRYALDGVKP